MLDDTFDKSFYGRIDVTALHGTGQCNRAPGGAAGVDLNFFKSPGLSVRLAGPEVFSATAGCCQRRVGDNQRV